MNIINNDRMTKIISVVLAVMFGVLVVSFVANAVTTISGTSITLENNEVISNATDGVIQLGGIASSTSVTLLNGETITNATNGIVTVGGNLLINGARTNDISGEEKFLNVTGNLTGTGDGSTNAKTWVIQASATRLAGANTVNGDMDEAILKGSITNKATANEANYIMRGLNIGATNRDGGNVNKLHGGHISATQKGSSVTTTDLWGLSIKVEADSPNTAPTNVFGLNVEYDMVAPTGAPTLSAGVRVFNSSDIAIAASDPLAGFMVDNTAADRQWQYGLYVDDDTIATADVRLSGGTTFRTGAGAPTATCTEGDLFIRTDGGDGVPNLYVCDSTDNWDSIDQTE